MLCFLLQFVHIIVLSLFAIVILRPELIQQQPNGEVVIDLDGGAGNNQSTVHVHLAKMTNGRKLICCIQMWWVHSLKTITSKTYRHCRYKFFSYFREQVCWISSHCGFVVCYTVTNLRSCQGKYHPWHVKWSIKHRNPQILHVRGVILFQGQPGYLMPFFCLQVFDFCLTCLTIVGYFSYVPNIKRWIEVQVRNFLAFLFTVARFFWQRWKYRCNMWRNDDFFWTKESWYLLQCCMISNAHWLCVNEIYLHFQESLPFKKELLAMDNDWLMLFAIMFFVMIMTIKVGTKKPRENLNKARRYYISQIFLPVFKSL